MMDSRYLERLEINAMSGWVFVTGGNGFIGSRTVEELCRKGYSVKCLLREGSDTRRIGHLPFEAHLGDVRDLSSLLAGAQGCDAMIHLAGISSWRQIREEADQLESVIVEGTRNVMEAAAILGIARTVFVSSSVAINGSKTAKIFNEKSTFRLKTPALNYSSMKRRAERVVQAYVKKRAVNAVIVNPCEVYGPKDFDGVTSGNLVGLLGGAQAFVCSGGTAVTHVEDVARGIVLALEKGRSGERYILGGDNLTVAQVARIVRRLAGKNERVLTVPNSLALQACKLVTRMGLPFPAEPDLLEYASLFWFMDSSKAKRELGYQWRAGEEVFKDVVKWLEDTQQIPGSASMRYGGGVFDARAAMIRVFALAQRKRVVILKSNPVACGEVLAASNAKGTFLEQLFATPAWHPIYSIESLDGPQWEQLARDFKKLMAQIGWREKLTPLTRKHTGLLTRQFQSDKTKVLDAETIARLTVRILYELLFDHELTQVDETLFYQASLEWRKEIAVKGKADPRIKSAFLARLHQLVAKSRFKNELGSYAADPMQFLSLFAQPFLISPQINIGDIFVAVFHYLRADPGLHARAKIWARDSDKARLGGILLESIRLKHPFPILERELKKNLHLNGASHEAGTHFFIMLDQFEQDPKFDPERWLKSPDENPYYSIPFAAGPRMCIGKPIAMELLVELLKSFLLEIPDEKTKPALGHLYSGRDNDGESSKAESAYQLKTFSRALWRSFRLRANSTKPLTCPARPQYEPPVRNAF